MNNNNNNNNNNNSSKHTISYMVEYLKKTFMAFRYKLSITLCAFFLLANPAQATPVIGPIVDLVIDVVEIPDVALPAVIAYAVGAVALLTEAELNIKAVKKDKKITPLPLAILTTSGVLKDKDAIEGLEKPDDLEDLRKEIYTFGKLQVKDMCPDGIMDGNPASHVLNLEGFSTLQEKMCDRGHNLKALKIKTTKDYRNKLNSLQVALFGVAAVYKDDTTGKNAYKQTMLQTIETLQQAVTAEYMANMEAIDAKIIIAEDMRTYAREAILTGPPTTLAVAATTAAAKLGLQIGINTIVTKTTPYVE